jgi:hypothetical protein
MIISSVQKRWSGGSALHHAVSFASATISVRAPAIARTPIRSRLPESTGMGVERRPG